MCALHIQRVGIWLNAELYLKTLSFVYVKVAFLLNWVTMHLKKSSLVNKDGGWAVTASWRLLVKDRFMLFMLWWRTTWRAELLLLLGWNDCLVFRRLLYLVEGDISSQLLTAETRELCTEVWKNKQIKHCSLNSLFLKAIKAIFTFIS